MRTALYLRISKDQTGEALGVTRQLEDCVEHAEALDWDVAEVYTDNDISATSGKARPSYRRMLADIDAGTIDAIVAWHPDRLYRKVPDLGELVDVCKRNNTAIATVKAGTLDLTSPTGRLVAGLLAQVATYEGEAKSDRWKRSWRQRRESGAPITAGNRLFGYTADNQVIPDEQAIAQEMATRLLQGEGIMSVCRWVDDQGVTAAGGRAWRPPTLKQYLTNPRIAGYSTLKREILGEGNWEPILDRETWVAVRALMTARTRPYAPRVALLNGLVFCGRCGARMVTGRSRDVRQYRCTARPDMPGCGRMAIAADKVEDIVEDFTRQRFERPDVRDRIADLRSQPSQAQGELAELQMRVAELERELDEPGVPVSTLLRAIERTKERQEVLLDQLAATPPSVLPHQGGPWPTDLRRRRALVDIVVARIDINPGAGGNVFRAERVALTPR
jgi:site-specific DNA recombinase